MENQEHNPCAWCGQQSSDTHHLFKRSTSPELIDDPKNQVRLCRNCHIRTESDTEFAKNLREALLWKPANLDIFLRAQASLEAILNGQNTDYLTPQLADNYLQLSGAAYNFYSEQLAGLERLEAPFYLETKKDKTEKEVKMLWNTTESGQKMITYKAKLKALEKTMSNLRSRLSRFRTELYIK